MPSSVLDKRTRRSPEWEVRFDDSAPLRSIVEAVQNVVSRVTFKISRTNAESPFFLKVDTADVAYVSCISVRYRLDHVVMSTPIDEIKFCVDCKHIVPCLSNIRQEHTLTLEGHNDGANPKIIIRTSDPEHPSHETCTELDTFVDSDNVQLFPMEFKMMLEIDLVMFRGLLKAAVVAKADLIVVRIYVKESAGQRLSFTHFSVQGEFKHFQSFCHEVSKDEDGSMIVRAATDSEQTLFDVDETVPTYEGIFPVDKVAGFIKPLQCRMLVAKVKPDMPIMFVHTLGGATDDVSHIRFLIAPLNTDTD
jgi:hypothetical protein